MAETQRPANIIRDADGKFTKGTTANPGGRSRSLQKLIKEKTDDGNVIVDFLVGVLLDKKKPMRWRMESARILAERGWSKPLENVRMEIDLTERIAIIAAKYDLPVNLVLEQASNIASSFDSD